MNGASSLDEEEPEFNEADLEEEEPSPEAFSYEAESSPYPEEQPSDSPLGLAAIHRQAIEQYSVNPLDNFLEVEFQNPQSDPYAGAVSESTSEDTQDFWGSKSDEISPIARDELVQQLQERAKSKALNSQKFQAPKNRK